MQRAERFGQIAIDSGDERNAPNRAEPGAATSQTADDHKQRSDRNDPLHVQAQRGARDRLHHTRGRIDRMRRQRGQDRDRTENVNDPDSRRGDRQAQWNRTARFTNLARDKRHRFGTGPCEGDDRPEDRVFQTGLGRIVWNVIGEAAPNFAQTMPPMAINASVIIQRLHAPALLSQRATENP